MTEFSFAATIFGVSFMICVAGILFYLHAERNTYKAVLDEARAMRIANAKLTGDLTATNARIDEFRNMFLKFKSEHTESVDAVQDHCARLREQQLILQKKQAALREKMIPTKLEVSIVDSKPAQSAKKPSPELVKTIKKQLSGLSQ